MTFKIQGVPKNDKKKKKGIPPPIFNFFHMMWHYTNINITQPKNVGP